MSAYTKLPGEIAALICLEAEYRCLTKGIRWMNHSPSQKSVEPNHDETNIPTKNTKSKDVMNPSPASKTCFMRIFKKMKNLYAGKKCHESWTPRRKDFS